jgi:hypothetical protein
MREIERLRVIEHAARVLMADLRRRYPNEELRWRYPFMQALDCALGERK